MHQLIGLLLVFFVLRVFRVFQKLQVILTRVLDDTKIHHKHVGVRYHYIYQGGFPAPLPSALLLGRGPGLRWCGTGAVVIIVGVKVEGGEDL